MKAILFDAGLTLVNCHPSMQTIMCQALAPTGIWLSEAQQERVQPLMGGYYAAYQRSRGLETSVADSWEFWRLVYHDVARDLDLPNPALCADLMLKAYADPGVWGLYPDVLPTLDALAAMGFRLGVISNWTVALHGILDRLEVSPYFEFVVTSAEAGYEKPHHGIYAHALAGRGLSPADCLYVGDSLDNDLYSSLEFGMDFVLIDRDGRHPGAPCRRVSDLRELISAVRLAG